MCIDNYLMRTIHPRVYRVACKRMDHARVRINDRHNDKWERGEESRWTSPFNWQVVCSFFYLIEQIQCSSVEKLEERHTHSEAKIMKH